MAAQNFFFFFLAPVIIGEMKSGQAGGAKALCRDDGLRRQRDAGDGKDETRLQLLVFGVLGISGETPYASDGVRARLSGDNKAGLSGIDISSGGGSGERDQAERLVKPWRGDYKVDISFVEGRYKWRLWHALFSRALFSYGAATRRQRRTNRSTYNAAARRCIVDTACSGGCAAVATARNDIISGEVAKIIALAAAALAS